MNGPWTRHSTDERALVRIWITGELPTDLDDWPDGWRRRLEAYMAELAQDEDLADHEVLPLAVRLVRRQFLSMPPVLEEL